MPRTPPPRLRAAHLAARPHPARRPAARAGRHDEPGLFRGPRRVHDGRALRRDARNGRARQARRAPPPPFARRSAARQRPGTLRTRLLHLTRARERQKAAAGTARLPSTPFKHTTPTSLTCRSVRVPAAPAARRPSPRFVLSSSRCEPSGTPNIGHAQRKRERALRILRMAAMFPDALVGLRFDAVRGRQPVQLHARPGHHGYVRAPPPPRASARAASRPISLDGLFVCLFVYLFVYLFVCPPPFFFSFSGPTAQHPEQQIKNDRTTERTLERTANERKNERTNERTNERMNKRTNERTNERTNKQTSKHNNTNPRNNQVRHRLRRRRDAHPLQLHVELDAGRVRVPDGVWRGGLRCSSGASPPPNHAARTRRDRRLGAAHCPRLRLALLYERQPTEQPAHTARWRRAA